MSKAKQNAAIETVANSLPKNEVIFLTFFILEGYKPYIELRKISVINE